MVVLTSITVFFFVFFSAYTIFAFGIGALLAVLMLISYINML